MLFFPPIVPLPLFFHPCRYERVTDDKNEDDAADERTENSCAAQYQSTTLRVLTHFVADTGEVGGASEEDGMGQQNFLLGSDWQVEVTQLVKDYLRVADPKVAQLMEGQVVMGLSAGTTKLQVVCVCISCIYVCYFAQTTSFSCRDIFSVTHKLKSTFALILH